MGEAETEALAQLEDELRRINEAYEGGRMRAFGADQEALLARFAEVARAQSALAQKHVEAGREHAEQHAAAEGAEDPELKQMLGTRGGQAAALTQELSVLCREIEETSRAALTSIRAQFADAEAAPVASDAAAVEEKAETTTAAAATATKEATDTAAEEQQ